MNDTELDEMLNRWSVPPVPPILRQRVRAGFPARPEHRPSPRFPKPWRTLSAGAILGVGALLVVVTQALPQPIRPPYTVDSEFLHYADDGSSAVEMYTTSYTNQNGAEILLSRSIPGLGFGTALGRALDAALPLWARIITPLTVSPKDLERLRRSAPRRGISVITECAHWACLVVSHWGFPKAPSGAGCVDGAVVGGETILNYPTTAVERRLGDRLKVTLWTAPDLGCFAMRIATEKQRPDGTFHLVTVKQAVKVTLNP